MQQGVPYHDSYGASDSLWRRTFLLAFYLHVSRGYIRNEVVIAEVTMDSLFDFDLTPLMSFTEPPFLTGKDVIAVMGDFAREVESALKVFD